MQEQFQNLRNLRTINSDPTNSPAECQILNPYTRRKKKKKIMPSSHHDANKVSSISQTQNCHKSVKKKIAKPRTNPNNVLCTPPETLPAPP